MFLGRSQRCDWIVSREGGEGCEGNGCFRAAVDFQTVSLFCFAAFALFARDASGPRMAECTVRPEKIFRFPQKLFERLEWCAIYTQQFRCSFRVGREVLLVARFEQRSIVGRVTLLSVWVKAYTTSSPSEPEFIRLFSCTFRFLDFA